MPGMGRFEWIMSPIGLLGCPALFQRLVEMAMKGLVNLNVDIDYILLHSINHFNHKQQLEKLFTRLRNANLKVNLEKYEFGATNVSFLRAVRNSKPPSTIQEKRQFMGLCNFFRLHA
jgi:hypothetical protein